MALFEPEGTLIGKLLPKATYPVRAIFPPSQNPYIKVFPTLGSGSPATSLGKCLIMENIFRK